MLGLYAVMVIGWAAMVALLCASGRLNTTKDYARALVAATVWFSLCLVAGVAA